MATKKKAKKPTKKAPAKSRSSRPKAPKGSKGKTAEPVVELQAPLWDPSRVEGEVKYVRLTSGQIVFVDPYSYGSHLDATRAALGFAGLRPPEGAVMSAGRVHVDRKKRTVTMGERDSRTLGVRSAPDDEDARAIKAFLFPER